LRAALKTALCVCASMPSFGRLAFADFSSLIVSFLYIVLCTCTYLTYAMDCQPDVFVHYFGDSLSIPYYCSNMLLACCCCHVLLTRCVPHVFQTAQCAWRLASVFVRAESSS
jgi:hypothetical protein